MPNYFDFNAKPGVLSKLNVNKTESAKYSLENIDYFVLDTNYDDYLVGYYCSNKYFGLAIQETYYVLARRIEFEYSKFARRINQVLNHNSEKDLKMRNNTHSEMYCKLNSRNSY